MEVEQKLKETEERGRAIEHMCFSLNSIANEM